MPVGSLWIKEVFFLANQNFLSRRLVKNPSFVTRKKHNVMNVCMKTGRTFWFFYIFFNGTYLNKGFLGGCSQTIYNKGWFCTRFIIRGDLMQAKWNKGWFDLFTPYLGSFILTSGWKVVGAIVLNLSLIHKVDLVDRVDIQRQTSLKLQAN